MDLLGSILSSMDKPPAMANKDTRKKEREAMKKKQDEDRAKLKKFRESVEAIVTKFVQDDAQERHKFPMMDKMHRSIIHDVAEVAGLTAFSFGEEEVNRHTVIFKKESVPCDDELAALRRGEDWDKAKAQLLATQKEQEKLREEEESKGGPAEVIPNSDYRDKYEHLIGKDAALQAARKTQTNKQYGFVPSENKRDLRSIEQTLADIRAKKKQKVDNDGSEN